ncbi:MAG: outer membrane beta-barrel protein [Prevotellaceae bacterium]|nr:outer membrane beta-barrel protein [Prevotellaceae bacterium]
MLLAGNSTPVASAAGFNHEILGSLSMLNSNLAPTSSGNSRYGIGYGGGMGYSCHFSSALSVRTGLHVNYYQSTTDMSGISESMQGTFPDELGWWESGQPPKEMGNDYNDYQANIKISDYAAQKSALYVQVPLLVELETLFSGSKYIGWYATGGVKAGYSIAGSSNASIKGLAVSGKLAYENVEITEAPPYLGFGNKGDVDVKANMDLGLHAVGHLEMGFRQQLTDKYALYAGVFGEYCFYNSAASSSSSALMEYETQPAPTYYQLRYNPSASVAGGGAKATYLLSFGVTVRIGFMFRKNIRNRNSRLFDVRYLSS